MLHAAASLQEGSDGAAAAPVLLLGILHMPSIRRVAVGSCNKMTLSMRIGGNCLLAAAVCAAAALRVPWATVADAFLRGFSIALTHAVLPSHRHMWDMR
jgi:hypothetical protein